MAKPTLTPAERIRATLDHQEPDRVPLDFSATGLSGLRVEAQDALLRHIEIDDIAVYGYPMVDDYISIQFAA